MHGVNLLTRCYMGCGKCTKRPYEIGYYLEAVSHTDNQKTFSFGTQ